MQRHYYRDNITRHISTCWCLHFSAYILCRDFSIIQIPRPRFCRTMTSKPSLQRLGLLHRQVAKNRCTYCVDGICLIPLDGSTGWLNCWSLRCSWSIACRRCSNYIVLLHWTLGFNILRKDNFKLRRETLKFWDLVRLIIELLQYISFILQIKHQA